MKNHKKPPKPKPAPPSKPSPQPRPAAAAATAPSLTEPKSFDNIRLDSMEHRIDCRLNSIERRIDLIGDDLHRIYYALSQIEEHLHLDPRLRWPNRAPDAEKSETQ